MRYHLVLQFLKNRALDHPSFLSMLRRTIVPRISAFVLFLKDSKGLPALAGLAVPQRGKKLGEMYHALSKADLKALKDRAAKIKGVPRVRKVPKARSPSRYNLFVKKHMPNYQGPVPSRMQAIAKLWKSQKKH
jgi:hypothetical protein